jgi:hypothetical protein
VQDLAPGYARNDQDGGNPSENCTQFAKAGASLGILQEAPAGSPGGSLVQIGGAQTDFDAGGVFPASLVIVVTVLVVTLF